MMLILKLFLACLVVGGAGSLFVWRKKRYAKFAPLYFSMLGVGLGFYGSLILFLSVGILIETISGEKSLFTASLFVLLVFTTTVFSLPAGAYFGIIYANYVIKTGTHKTLYQAEVN